MDKTIHELPQLTEVAESDELIVYDVSDATSKKVTKQNLLKGKLGFPDYSENLFTSSTDINTWTAPKDCWFEWSFVSGSGTRSISINGNNVTLALTISNQYYSHFEGFLKEGDVVSSGNNVLNINTTKAYALS